MTTAHDIRAAQRINAFARLRMQERGDLMNDLIREPAQAVFSLVPRNLDEAIAFSKIIADTEFVPKDYRGKYGNILVAIQMGAEVGLPPMQALQNIAVINGRPSIWGDAMWALVNSHPLCEWTKEEFSEAAMTATCTVKRRGRDPVVRSFSKADAEKARLWSKEGPWQMYPRRMLQMRARGFACRDALPEALKGLSVGEEQADIEKDMGDVEVVQQPKPIVQPPKAHERIDFATGEIEQQPAIAKEEGPALITPAALKIINQKLADKQLAEQFCSHFAIADPCELPMAKVNEALSWIEKQSKS